MIVFYSVNTNPHKAFSQQELKKIFKVAEDNSPMIHALILLLLQGAMRIQDAVGLSFRDITSLKADKDGRKKLTLRAKKTTARDIYLT